MLIKELDEINRLEQNSWISTQRILSNIVFRLSKVDIDVDLLSQSLEELKLCLDLNFKTLACLNEFFSTEFRPTFGHLVHLLLEFMSNDRYEVAIRIKLAEILSLIVDLKFKDYSSDALSLILPGIVGRCSKVALNCSNVTSFTITVTSLKIISDVICCCINNDEYEKLSDSNSNEIITKELSICKNKAWFSMACEKLLPTLANLSAKLCTNKNQHIRLALLDGLLNVHEQCFKAFGNPLTNILVDLCVILLNDSYPNITNKADDIVKWLQRSHDDYLFSYLSDKLYKLCTKLPFEIKNSTSGKLTLQNLINIIRAFGPDLFNRLCLASSSYLNRFCNSIASIILINKKKLMITQAYSENDFHSLDISILFPLEYDIDYEMLVDLFRHVVLVQDIGIVFDMILENLICTDMYNQISYAILLCAVIENLIRIDQHSNEIIKYLKCFIQEALKILSHMDVIEPEINDQSIKDKFSEHSNESCLTTCLIISISLATCNLQSDPFFNRLMIDTIYECLKWCASSNYVVKTSAENALNLLAKKNDMTVSEMLLKYGNYIAFKVSIVARDFTNNQRSPLVLSEMLKRCDSSDMYDQVRFIVIELAIALDRNDQDQAMLILQALHNFVRALRRWFKNLKPTPDEAIVPSMSDNEEKKILDEEEPNSEYIAEAPKPPIPFPIQSAVEVLQRTKHMISSPYLPIQILVLDILDDALICVEHFENELLPMIHQNWLGLIQAFDSGWNKEISDDRKLVAAKAIHVVETMCKLSGTFVYRKIMDELAPKLIKFMSESFPKRRTPLVYTHTSTYKFQLAVLQSIPTFVEKLELLGENKEIFMNILKMYSENKCQEMVLRNEAAASIKKIELFGSMSTNEKSC